MTAAQPAQNAQVKYLECIQRDTHVLADKLKTSADPEAIFYGLQLAECVADENLFVGFGMTNKDGEVFTGRGNLVGTSSRLDRFYLQRQSKIGRKDIERYLSEIQLRSGEKWRFLTLTMPKLKGYRFALVMKVFDEAFKKLRDSAFWKKNVRAGTKSKEFTLGEEWENEGRLWTLADDGFHIHAHLILAAKWLENRKINKKTGEPYYRELAENWKKALIKSAQNNGVVFKFNTDDELPIVDVRLIKSKAINEGEISLKDAIAETAKYITKPNLLEHLPIEQIMEINSFLKGKRMIEPLGEANKRKGKAEANDVVIKTDTNNEKNEIVSVNEEIGGADTFVLKSETIERFSQVKTECLKLIEKGEMDAATARIRKAFEMRRAFRRRQLALSFPDAEFMTLDGEVFSSEDYFTGDFRNKARPIMKT